MNLLTYLLTFIALAPLIDVGGSVLLSWVVTLVIIAGFVWFIVWCLTRFLGPPNIPEPIKWILWVIASIILFIFIFAAFGLKIP